VEGSLLDYNRNKEREEKREKRRERRRKWERQGIKEEIDTWMAGSVDGQMSLQHARYMTKTDPAPICQIVLRIAFCPMTLSPSIN